MRTMAKCFTFFVNKKQLNDNMKDRRMDVASSCKTLH